MIQLSYIRSAPEEVIARLGVRGIDAAELVNKIVDTDREARSKRSEMEQLQARGNALAKQVGDLMRSGKADEANSVKQETGLIKETLKQLETRVAELEAEVRELIVSLPNTPNESVPHGKTADDNKTILEWGSKPNLSENALPHWELAAKYDIIDFELGVKITGAGFPVYKGKGATLQRALINFFLTEAIKSGYTEVQPPIVVNADSGFGTGQLPDKEGQMYFVPEDGLYLIPTAEVPITNFYREVILEENQLPVKNAGYTPCFRREAGSYGAHVRGLNRLHQFDKVEIVQVVKPETSYQVLEEMSLHVQGLLQKLGLHYRVLLLCGGDMGMASAKTYDMEVWSGAQQRWLECSSVSNFETYQTNRLKCRYRNAQGKTELAHTLNGSALALPRIVAALLENNQSENGIVVPEVLRQWTGFDLIN